MDELLYIAVDIGGSHIRISSFTQFSGMKVHYEFVAPYYLQDDVGNFSWDIHKMFQEIVYGIKLAVMANHDYKHGSIGIDCFGNDFGLLDSEDNLVLPVLNNKSSRFLKHAGTLSDLLGGPEKMYRLSGMYDYSYNAANEVLAIKFDFPEQYLKSQSFMIIADLFGFWLTGIKQSERTGMSVTQLYNAETGGYIPEVAQELGIGHALLPLVNSGTVRGAVLEEVCPFLDGRKFDFINVAEHDTASSVITVMDDKHDMMFVSSGTMSVVGCFVSKPIKTAEAFRLCMSNELAANGEIRLLKNMLGMWIVNECRSAWGESCPNFKILDALTSCEKNYPGSINPDDQVFIAPTSPENPMPERVAQWCVAHGFPAPINFGQTLMAIYRGLAEKYFEIMRNMENLTGNNFSSIKIIGGGSKNNILNQLVADYCNKPVYAGPVEASTIGNIVVQLLANREVKNYREGVTRVLGNDKIKVFLPNGAPDKRSLL